MATSPKICLLYYKNVLDLAVIDFFSEYGSSFIKQDSSYVLAKKISKMKLEEFIESSIVRHIKETIKPYSLLDPEYYFIIGACMPRDNMMLKYKSSYFPAKLDAAVKSKFQYKYLLKENDLKIDMLKMNEAAINVFDKMFESRAHLKHAFGKEYSSLFFIKHKKLDCYSMFKILKNIYGKDNCINLFESKIKSKSRQPLAAVNDLYVHDKIKMCKSQEFKLAVEEIHQYADGCIKSVLD